METIDNISGDHDHVKVSGMMHLLTSGNFESKERLYQTIEDVYHNFTSIEKTIEDETRRKISEEEASDGLIGFWIALCKCSLRRILEKDGITMRESLAHLLAEIEVELVDLIKFITNWSSNQALDIEPSCSFSRRHPLMRRLMSQPDNVEDLSIRYNLIKYDLVLELLDQSLQEMNYYDNYAEDMRAWKERFIVLKQYLEFLIKDGTHGDDLEKVLSAVENAAYVFLKSTRSSEKEIQSNVRDGLLKALILKIDSSGNAPLMSDALLIGYVKCVQENCLVLMKDGAFDRTDTLKDHIKILYDGISFLIHLLIAYPSKHDSEQERLSNIRLDFQAFARTVGSVICSCFDNPGIEEISCLNNLLERIDFIKEEIIKTICSLVLEKPRRETQKQDQLGSLILLLQNLKEFMDRKPALIVTWKDQENLILFVFYLIQNNISGGDNELSRDTLHSLDVATMSHENLKRILISAQVVAFKMACALLRRHGKFHWWELFLGTRDGVNSHMCVRILRALAFSLENTSTPLTDDLLVAFEECVQDTVIELQQFTSSAPLNDHINILQTGLLFLVHFFVNYRDEDKLSHVKVYFQDLLKSVVSAICSCFSDWMIGDRGTGERIELSDLVAKLNLITSKTTGFLYLIVLKKVGRESPKTYQLGSLNLLLKNWKEMTEGGSNLITTWKDQFEMIYKSFVSLRSFITNTINGDDESQNLCSSITNAGYVAEYLLTTSINGNCPDWCISLWIPEFMEHVELIKTAVTEFNKKKGKGKEIGTAVKETSHVSTQSLLVPTLPNLVVGFDEEVKLIKEQLSSDFTQLDVISVIGMPGLGKTTLARKVYEDQFTVSHFDVRAWCSVSQEYNKKELFLTILGSKIEITDELKKMNETELSTKVHQQLMGRRYLIVLDDIWSIDAFNELSLFFPDNNERSRIMLTSRIKVTGSKAKHLSDPIEPGMLTDQESWQLIERKVFREGKCPLELRQIGDVIVKKCRGLPLAVVVVAGILAKSAEKREFWNEVAGNLSSYRDSQSHIMATLELSYKYLPDCLKPMFLYLGVFPEDEEISTDKLMQLWLAEGLVQETESTDIESQAEKDLMDLIDRSLIMVAKRTWDGRVKACHIHDLLRDMCLAKAKEEKFMEQVNVHSDVPYPVMYRRRLSIFVERNDEITSRHFAAYTDLHNFSLDPPIYSLLFFAVGLRSFQLQRHQGLAQVISNLKLLKVFDAKIFTITEDIFDKDLITLIHLRYLLFHDELWSIPSSISRLRNLEILIINGTSSSHCTTVPETIWEMTKLRHIDIGCAKFSSAHDNPFTLKNLQTLSKPRVYLGEEEKLFSKVPCLKKLKWEFTEEDYYKCRTHSFPNMESLDKLESLKARFLGSASLIGEFKLPQTLKKLSIIKFPIEWSQISIFKKLPNLEALKICGSGSGSRNYWNMRDEDVFSNLKYLKLDNLVIEGWSASSINFPSLEKVVLRCCAKLEEIPYDLGEFDSLQKIEVIRCNSYLVEMARKIEEEHKESGNESLTVYIEED